MEHSQLVLRGRKIEIQAFMTPCVEDQEAKFLVRACLYVRPDHPEVGDRFRPKFNGQERQVFDDHDTAQQFFHCLVLRLICLYYQQEG